MSKKELYEEVIEEIGTQTLAKFGLNIFSLNTYNAYVESVKATNNIIHLYKNNPIPQEKSESELSQMSEEERKNYKSQKGSAVGKFFEEIDVGISNVTQGLFNTSSKVYTTDQLHDIKTLQDALKSGKKLENMTEKQIFIYNNFYDEIKNMNFTKGDLAKFYEDSAKHSKNGQKSFKNNPTTDVITLDSNGKIIHKSQHKSNLTLQSRMKEIFKKDHNGNYKYLDNNDLFTVPLDGYKETRDELEKIIKNAENSTNEDMKTKAEQAKKALQMLNANNRTNRLMCENPRTTAVVMQTVAATGHVLQAGTSDAIAVALSTLANGVIYEVKDMFLANPIDTETSISQRIKRLLTKVIEDFKKTFARGAGFGTIDVAVGILSQIFKTIAAKLRHIWSALRNSVKSIYNAIYSYIKGEIPNYRVLLSTIIKALFSAQVVIIGVALEAKLEAVLAPILTPFVASFVAPAFAIVIGAFAVVLTSRSIDMAIDSMFTIFKERDLAKMRYEEIEALCAERIPYLIEKREEIEKAIKITHEQRMRQFDCSFKDYEFFLKENNNEKVFESLAKINALYDKELEYKTMQDVESMLKTNTGMLKW